MSIEKTKTCSKCGETKSVSEFHQCNICRVCYGKYVKNYQMKNKDKLSEYGKKYRLKNKNKLKEKAREYRKKHKNEIEKWRQGYKEESRKLCQKYRAINKGKIREYGKGYYKKNKNKIIERVKIYQSTNKERVKKQSKEYRLKNRDKARKYGNEYTKHRYQTDPKFKLNMNISNAIRTSLHGNKKGRHWEDLVGYTLNKLKKYLENLFTEGMTWELFMQGEIHIDHKIPISAFNFTKPKHLGFQKCWALENLQPMWVEDNLSKTNKLFYDFQGHLAL